MKEKVLNMSLNIFWGLLGLIIIIGLFNGGYYTFDAKIFLEVILSAAIVVFSLIKAVKKEVVKLDYINILILLAVGSTFVTWLNSINKYESLIGINLTVILFIIFVFSFTVNNEQIRIFFISLMISGSLVALLGLLDYMGFIQLKAGFQFGKRMHSTLQYANATALLLYINYLYYLIGESFNKIRSVRLNYLLTGLANIILYGFLLTYSRGMLIIAVFTLFILLILVDKATRIKLTIKLVSTLGPVFIGFIFYTYLINHHYTFSAILVIIGNIGISIYLQKILYKQMNKLSSAKYLWIFITCIVLFIIISLASDNTLLNRIKSISWKAGTASERLIMYRDSWQIVKKYPYYGVGDGGWARLYPIYQTKLYTSTEPHSQLVKVALDYGMPFFLFYISIWVFIIMRLYKAIIQLDSWEGNEESRYLAIFIFIALITALFHSVVDFDWSIPVIALICWFLAGSSFSLVGNNQQHNNELSRLNKKNIVLSGYWPYLVISGFILVFSTKMLLGVYFYNQGLSYLKSKDYNKVISLLERASDIEPRSARYYFTLAKVYEDNFPLKHKQIEDNYRTAYNLDPYSISISQNYGYFLIKRGKFNEGVRMMENILKLRPNRYKYYPELVKGYLKAAVLLSNRGEEKESRIYLNRIKSLYSSKDIPPRYFTPEVSLAFAQAAYLEGKLDLALEYLNKAKKDPRLRGDVSLIEKLINNQLRN